MATILIVDDEPTIRSVCERALTAPGRTLLCAGNTDDALALVEGQSLDVAILDKNLGQESGLALAHALKARFPDSEIVMITAFGSLDSAVEALRLGLFDYVTKPFDLNLLESVVNDALTKAAHNSAGSVLRFTKPALLASHSEDPLTALPNRSAFVERVDAALANTHNEPNYSFAVLLLDLNDFGRINDSLGHGAGDDLLVQWVSRTKTLLGQRDTLARLGADQLTILLEDVHGPEDALAMVDRVNHAHALPFMLDGRPVATSVSIGITMGHTSYDRGDAILRDAGAALVHAKLQGRSSHAIFEREMHSRAVENLALQQGLRRAVEHCEFVPYYQPIVAVESGRIVAFEALARWQDPERGLLAPDQFLNGAVEGGYLAEISWQVMCAAFAQQRRWLDELGEEHGPSMNVNVAPDLLLRRRFVEDVDRLLRVVRIPPSRVRLEVTEVIALDNTPVSAEVIQSLRQLGIAVCLDDFGTGYASLQWLHRFPVDEVKIDRSFVAEMTIDRRSHILVGAAVNLAHSLGLSVVAEGVETENQLAEIREMGCEYAQGYLFGRPLTADNAEHLLRQEIAIALGPPH